MENWILTPTQRYAACGLFAIALNRSQVHQARVWSTLVSLVEEAIGAGMGSGGDGSVSDHPNLWIHESSGLLLPVLRFLQVDDQAAKGLKETAGSSSQARHHVGDFLKLLLDDNTDMSTGRADKELALAKAVDAMELSMRTSSASIDNVEKKASGIHRCIGEHDADASGIQNLEKPVEDGVSLSYEMKLTVLYELLSACMVASPEDGNIARLRKGYDSRHRVALRLLTTWLGVNWLKMEALEAVVACYLVEIVKGEDGKKEVTEITDGAWDKWKQGGLIGAAAFTGGTVMAVTGGLAAPAIAQGLGALAPTLGGLLPAIGAGGFAAAAGAMGSVGGSIPIAASFGAAGAGLSGFKMARRTGSIEEFQFRAIGDTHNQGHLAVGILVAGLVFKEDDFVLPWEGQNENLERYALQWESENLTALGTAIKDWLTSKLASQLMGMGAMMTVLGTLVAALTIPATILAAADIIDNKWAVAVDRSDKAGKLLAEVLLEGLHGNRPVTLVGFSLGARVIFKCLQHLAESEGGHVLSAGFVERVILLGAPIPIKDENWVSVRKMVAGRFVNAYSTNDWTLGIVFRASLFSQGLAGIQPVDSPGIENVDVTQIIENHAAYVGKTKQVLEKLEIESYSPVWKI
ncbi:hypothetical protein Droror1_Dr00007213 [Drosera rotundifolia]